MTIVDESSQADNVLQGLGEARRLDDAFDLVEALESGKAPGKHLELTDVHLHTLVNACAHAGRFSCPCISYSHQLCHRQAYEILDRLITRHSLDYDNIL